MFYIILLLAIFIPFLFKSKLSLIISFSLIFILWGLEYQMVQDWNGNVARWYGCIKTVGYDVADLGAGGKTLEPLYIDICRWHKPIGYFGQLITTAILGLILFYYLITKYVSPKYYWLSIFVFLIRPQNALLLFNSNRMSIAVMFTMIAVFVLIRNYKCSKRNDIIKILIALVCVRAASQVHSGAAFAYLLPFLYLIVKYIDVTKYNILFIVSNILFLGRFFFSLESYSDYFLTTDMAAGFEDYHVYSENLETSNKVYSLFETILYFIPMNYALLSYKKMKPEFKFFTLCFTLAMILNGFLISNLGRILQFYHIYMVVLIPYLLNMVRKEKSKMYRQYSKPIMAYMLLYSVFAFYSAMQGYLYCRWNNLQTTIFDAPLWM